MNILASYNAIKKYVAVREDAEKFARKISLCGPSVERIYPQAPAFDNMVIGKILEVKPHPQADKLRLVSTDVGKRVLEIVCGGVNLEVGMKVVVALVGAKVRWHGQGELVELQPAEIRGVRSEGMICGANEIGLADAFPHADKEILDLSWCKGKPGMSLAKALDLDDTVFDIEVTTNRPDAFSIIGLAREAAAILGAKFSWCEPIPPATPRGVNILPFTVKNQVPSLCTRYQAIAMDNVTVGPSPWWLKNRLRLAGIRPINTIVDITNYVMLEHGQPMHAFDYDKLAGRAIVVRHARAGEKIKTLDGVERALATEHAVIADAEKPIAVAGVMGGEETGVTEKTTNIVFECATFDPVSVRRTARALNLHSDASLRYEKGLPEEQTSPALARAVELCQKVACGRVASVIIDLDSAPPRRDKYVFRPAKAEKLIGVKIPKSRMIEILKSLGFGIVPKGGIGAAAKYEVTVPYWRVRDIEDERDLAEEIARVYGYANLPSEMPSGALPVAPADPLLALDDRAKDFLRAAGYMELLQYSMVSKFQLEDAGFDPSACLRIANPLSSDFEYMRPSLIPSTLTTIKQNEGLFPEGRVFEVSRAYFPRENDLPEERPYMLAAVYGRSKDDRLFREAKGLIESFLPPTGGKLLFVRGAADKTWHPGRSARVLVGGTEIGTVGEIHPAIAKKFGVDGRIAMLYLDLAALSSAYHARLAYEPIPLFPPVLRDLAFIVAERTEYADVERAMREAGPLLRHLELFDVYRGEHVGEGKKSMALHLTFAHPERTLTAEEVDESIKKMMTSLTAKFGAVIRA